jgi:hypothetical protein
MKASTLNFVLLALVDCLYIGEKAEAKVILMNDDKNTKAYDCYERITPAGEDPNGWSTNLKSGRAKVIDFGESFMVVQPDQDAMAYSGNLSAESINDFRTNQPEKGITMGKGQRGAYGTYFYIGTTYMISWDCRK